MNSLAIYQKVSTDEKLSMAYAMSCYLQYEKNQALPGPGAVPPAIIENSNQQQALLPVPQQRVIDNVNVNAPEKSQKKEKQIVV